MPIQNITSLKDKYEKQDIYIIASGASCNYIDPSFFHNKITIGVNQVYKKYKCTYIVRKECKFLEDSIRSGAQVIISKWDSGNPKKRNPKLNSEGNEHLSFFQFEHPDNMHTHIDESVIGTDRIIVSYSTITSAMHIAAYMGAKNIIIVGHDCGLIDDKFVFDGYYNSIADTPWTDWNQYTEWLKEIEAQSLTTKRALCKHYNCNIYSLNPFINFNMEGHKYKN